MNNYEKPPLGAGPSWFALPNRIRELADAISRHTEHTRIMRDIEVTAVMRQWATEIICHCDAIDRLREVGNE